MATMRSEAALPESRKKRYVSKHREHRKKLRHRKMTVSQKIKRLKGEGYKQDQAVAIALSMQRRGEVRKG